MSLADSLQAILTKGIDAAAAIKTAQYQAQNPAGVVTGPNGQRSIIGQTSYGLTQTVSGLAPLLVVGGLVLVAVVLLPRLIGKR